MKFYLTNKFPHINDENKYALIIQIIFIIILSLIYMSRRIFPSIDMLFALTIAALIWNTRHRALLIDLLPFFILLLTFQSLRSFADDLTPVQIHITDLVSYEKLLFKGVIPAYYIQQIILNKPYTLLITIPANFLYMSHFLTPLIMAIILWYKKKNCYWRFVIGLIILTYLAFITYILFPAAPPWWATKYGYLIDQPVTLTPFAYPSLIEFAGPNPVAAMPSLHMAYPTFIALYCIYIWGKKYIWVILLPLGVGFSTMLLGHHYFIDLIAGAIYAIGIFYIILFWSKKKVSKHIIL